MAKPRRIQPSRVTPGPLVPANDAEPDRRALDEEPSDADVIRFDDDSTRCRRCKTLLYDDLDVCPRCGEPVQSGSGPKMPIWILVALGLVIAAFLAPAILPVLAGLF